MKNAKFFLTLLTGMAIYAVVIHSSSCTREDAVVGTIDPPQYEYGTDTITSSNTKWSFDKAHSSVLWETPYKGVGSLLTGRFNTFNTNVQFFEDHPENSSITGFVVLSTVNTGEPGRDGGCLLTTFGTVAISDTARIVSKKIEFDGKDGYIATIDLTFHGVTKELKMQLNYTGKTYFPDATDALKSYWVQGLSGQFEMNALSDFAIVSTNIADRVVVKMNVLFKYFWNRP